MKRSLFSLRDAGDPPRRALSLAVAGIAAIVGHGSARAAEACSAAARASRAGRRALHLRGLQLVPAGRSLALRR